jgi:tetratricopeptide (TPR) repeat protein
VVERARERGFLVAVGISQSIAQDTAYAPWRQILRAVLGPETAGASAASLDAAPEPTSGPTVAALEEIITRTNPEWAPRLPLLGDVLRLPIPDNAVTTGLDARLRASALSELVVEIVAHRAAQRPLLLILDDAHWMDEASLGLTVAVGRALAHVPALLIVSHRPPAEDQAVLPELSDLPFHERLDLNELTPTGVNALVTNRLDGEPTPLALGLIFAESHGNPFFTEELVDTLREAGDLVPQLDGRWWLSDRLFRELQKAKCLLHRDGEWILAPDASLAAADLGLPDSIHNIVLARLDRLPDQVKLTLKAASVVGATFTVEVLLQAHPAQPGMAEVQAHLGILEERDFTRLEGEASPRYMFKHNVTREVAYETLLYTQRREIHYAVGQALERLAPDEPAPLAHHFFAAEAWTAALRYQILAGRQSQRLFANFDAIEHFNRALTSAVSQAEADTQRQQQEVHAALGELLTTVSTYEAALEHLRHALDLAHSLHDRDAEAHTCRWFGRLHELRGDYDLALQWISRGQEALQGRETADIAEASITAGLIYARQGDYSKALDQARNALRVAEQLNAISLTGRANGLWGIIDMWRGQVNDAIQHLQRALALYEEAGNLHGQGLVHNNLAMVYLDLGQWPDAERHWRRAHGIFRDVGDVYNRTLTENNLGTVARFQGRLDEAEASFRMALRSLEQLGSSPYHVALWEMNLGDVCVARGQVDEARRHFAVSRENAARAQSKALMPDLHRLSAEAALLAGELELATEEAQQSRAVACELSMRGDEGHSLRVLGQVAAARGDGDAAERHLLESGTVLREVHQQYGEALSQLALAQFYHSQRRSREAAGALAGCIPVFERLDAALDLAKARALRDEIAGLEPAGNP